MNCSEPSVRCLNGGLCLRGDRGILECKCSLEWEGPWCQNASLPYEVTFGSLYSFAAIIVIVQLAITIRSDGRRTTLASSLLFLSLFACGARVASFFIKLFSFIPRSVPENLGDLFYPLLFVGLGLTVCVWAEVYHERLTYTTIRSYFAGNLRRGCVRRSVSRLYVDMARSLLGKETKLYGTANDVESPNSAVRERLWKDATMYPSLNPKNDSGPISDTTGIYRETERDNAVRQLLATKINTMILPFGAVRLFFCIFAALLSGLEVAKWIFTTLAISQEDSSLRPTATLLRRLYQGYVGVLLLVFTLVFCGYGAELFIKLRLYRTPSTRKRWEWKLRARIGFVSLVVCTFVAATFCVTTLYNASPLVLEVKSIISPLVEFFLIIWFPCALWRTSTSLDHLWLINPNGGDEDEVGSLSPNAKGKARDRLELEYQSVEGECYICLEDKTSRRNPLISPCGCSGSTKYVHRDCLRQWCMSSDRLKEPLICPLCNHKYLFHVMNSNGALAVLRHPKSMRHILTFTFAMVIFLAIITVVSALPAKALDLWVRLWLSLLGAIAVIVVIRAFSKKLRAVHNRARAYSFVFVSRKTTVERGNPLFGEPEGSAE